VSTYPVTFEADYVEQRSRLTTFFRLLLVIPHLLIVAFWGLAVFFGVIVAWFALYLSYTYAGQAFTTFQWDALLLEAGFLAIFLPGGSVTLVWLYRWLVFRYVFMAGTAKLLNPQKTVLIPDLRAGCSLADSITAGDIRLLRQRYPAIEAQAASVVDCGTLTTGGGVSLCIDTMLHVIARELGVPVASETARILEYSRAWDANREQFPAIVDSAYA